MLVLVSREQAPACPPLITRELVAQIGNVDTIIAHGDFDGIMSAIKFALGGVVKLGERRIDVVRRYLAVEKGVPVYRIHDVSFGSEKPVAENKTREGRAANRRVDIRLMTNTAAATTQQPTANPAPPSM